ncbi:hypothetical protein SPRG_03668 [Saprolegnia parasitica CBS 223.65]|uniref:Arsenate reductase n=1 Tax=Saprolegnia parasitica (strain CBS 223.65) TaxID=695850 RepID=A0A067CMP0_SAPPC|nr:hypothetical protein SPRG_03668 [Saprolegnia parasitica CBS 223.65]KDO31748.1 hypothetical protein SPRG_03668 [Saprolegnia parasitica CBS 223.65]|eukprot:XP_012197628.1 hypothetical protein SPRG_03668 [Saprolegnia parasitica CBS 223.65]
MPATLYQNPLCNKCCTAKAMLLKYNEERPDESKLDYQVFEYLHVSWTREMLEDILAKIVPGEKSPSPLVMMRKIESEFTDLGLDKLDPVADRLRLLDAMIAHPILIERPIFIVDDKAVVARPADRIFELLS